MAVYNGCGATTQHFYAPKDGIEDIASPRTRQARLRGFEKHFCIRYTLEMLISAFFPARIANAFATARGLRIGDGPDEVHLRQIIRLEQTPPHTIAESPYMYPFDPDAGEAER